MRPGRAPRLDPLNRLGLTAGFAPIMPEIEARVAAQFLEDIGAGAPGPSDHGGELNKSSTASHNCLAV
jgi:hypothetical protein